MDKGNRGDRWDRGDRGDRWDRWDRGNRWDRGDRGERGERRKKSERRQRKRLSVLWKSVSISVVQIFALTEFLLYTHSVNQSQSINQSINGKSQILVLKRLIDGTENHSQIISFGGF